MSIAATAASKAPLPSLAQERPCAVFPMPGVAISGRKQEPLVDVMMGHLYGALLVAVLGVR